MDRRNLEYFRAVAHTGSISRAAASMSVTQPAVSKQISRLESTLSLKLFHRTSAGMAMTAAGEALYDLGGDVLTRFDRIEDTLKARFTGRPAMLFAVPLVRVLLQSGINESGLESMPVMLAEGASTLTGGSWPFFAPFLGALGAFVAGSNTISNLTFAQFQWSTGAQIGVSPETVVAAQAVGGAGGNPISVHNIVAASATVGLLGREGDLLRKVLLVTLYYCTAAGAITYIMAHGVGFNLGTIGLLVIVMGLALLAWELMRRDRADAVSPAREK